MTRLSSVAPVDRRGRGCTALVEGQERGGAGGWRRAQVVADGQTMRRTDVGGWSGIE